MVDLDTTPHWIRTAALPSFPRLAGDLSVDVAVVGGGLVGITTAYLLKVAGVKVALLERAECAAIDTGHTTAHLTMVTDELLTDLVKNFGRDIAMAVWDGGRIAIDTIDEICAAENIDCEFRRVPGFLHAALKGAGLSKDGLGEQADLAREMGFAATFVPEIGSLRLPGVRFEQQALFHPRQYLAGLLRAIPGDGSAVFEHTAADEVSDQPLTVKAGGHKISCGYVVVATHNPIVGKANLASATLLQTKLALYTSYALAGRLRAGQIAAGLYWDTSDPYHYLRVEPGPGHDFAIFGGADHKTGQVTDTRACYDGLEKTLRRIAPQLELTDRWSGQVIETADGLPLIGETAARQFASTGFAGNGMTFGTIAAMMARDAVLGRPSPWREIFDPGRTRLRAAAWDYVRENKDYLYYMVRDRLATKHARSLSGLAPGQGKVVEIDGRSVAAYRDAQGCVTLRSAICTHMGCEVRWNAAETTWDCPCHGSRFKTEGSIIAGPAEAPLEDVAPES